MSLLVEQAEEGVEMGGEHLPSSTAKVAAEVSCGGGLAEDRGRHAAR